MNSAKQIGDLLFDIQEKVARLGSTSQLANTTVGGESAVPVADVVTESVVTNDALPDVQTDVADAGEGVSDLQSNIAAVMDDLVARLEDAAADLGIAAASLVDSDQDVSDAFGLQIKGLSDRVDQIVVGAGGTLILFSDEGPDGTAPTGSTWFMINEAENIVGQWQQTGPKDAPVWTPRAIESSVIANLDVGKLTAGQAALAQVVAMKIAAATADIQTVNVGNLFVTQGATMQQAVIEYLFANVVTAKKITADMLDVNSLNGVSVTGLLLKTAATGQRLELLQTRMDIYNAQNALSGRIYGGLDNGIVTGASLVLQAINGSKSGQFLVAAPLDVSCSVSPAPYVLPGFSYTGTTLKGAISAVAEGLVVKGPLLTDEIWDARDNGRIIGPFNQSTPNGNRVITAGTFDRLNYAYTNQTTGARTAVPVVTGDPLGETPNVYVAATDFRFQNGKSALPLTGSTPYGSSLGAQSSDTLTVNFPAGRFATAPTVTANGSNSRVTVGINSVTSTSVTFALGNWTSALVNSVTVTWTATPNAA